MFVVPVKKQSPTRSFEAGFQLIAPTICALTICFSGALSCAQNASGQESVTRLPENALNAIFEPTDLSPAPVVEQWASQILAHQLETEFGASLTRQASALDSKKRMPHRSQVQIGNHDLPPVRDSFTAPKRENFSTPIARLVRPKTNPGVLQPIPESEMSEMESPIRDYHVGMISFQEPEVEAEEPKGEPEQNESATIELVSKPKQDEKPNSPEKDQLPDEDEPLIQDELSLEKLASQIKEQIALISKEPGDETLQQEQLNQLNLASGWIQKANNSQTQIKAQLKLKDSFKSKLNFYQEKLEAPLPSEMPDPSSSSEELQMQLQSKRQDLQLKKTELSENQRKMEDRDKRIAQLPADRTAALEKLSKSKLDLSGLADQPEGSSKQLSTLILKAQQWAVKKEIEALNIEAPRQEQIGKLLPLERSLLSKEIEKLETDIQTWSAAYNAKRQMEIADQTKEAAKLTQKAVNNDPGLSVWAQLNQQLALERSNWTDGIKEAQTNSKSVTAKLDEVDASLNTLRQQTENELTTEVGISLVEQRHGLISPWESQARIQKIQSKLNDINLKKLSWQEDRQKISSVEAAVAQLLPEQKLESLARELVLSKIEYPEDVKSEAFVRSLNEEKERLNSLASQLVESRIKLLDDLNEDYEVYRNELTQEKNDRLGLIKKITEMRKFVDEKALWIRSANPIWEDPIGPNQSDLSKSVEGLTSLCSPNKWTGFLDTITQRVTRRPSESALAGLVLACLFVVSQRMRENQ